MEIAVQTAWYSTRWGPRRIPPVCSDKEATTCSDGCKVYFDAVIDACDGSANATHISRRILSEGKETVWDPKKEFIGGYSLPYACVDDYVLAVVAANPDFFGSTCDETWTQVALSAISFYGPCEVDHNNVGTEACPESCQARYDAVNAKCTPGVDTYIRVGETLSSEKYQVATLYHEEGYKWASCDYGYKPTTCDVAIRRLDSARTGEDDWFGNGPRPTPPVCEHTDASSAQTCPETCRLYIDGVVEQCDAISNAKYSPPVTALRRGGTSQRWESPKSLEDMGFGTSSIFSDNRLSDPCWEYYTVSAAAVNSNFSDEPSSEFGSLGSELVPPGFDQFGSNKCQQEMSAMFNDANLQIQFSSLLLANAFADCDFLSDSGCGVDFTDVELVSFKGLCEEAGGKVLTYDFSEECPVDDDNAGRLSLGTNIPFCVGSSCIVDEACSAVAEFELALFNSGYTTSECTPKVSNCDALASATSTILTPVARASITSVLVLAVGIFM